MVSNKKFFYSLLRLLNPTVPDLSMFVILKAFSEKVHTERLVYFPQLFSPNRCWTKQIHAMNFMCNGVLI